MSRPRKPYGMPYRRAVRALAVQRGIKGATLNALQVILDHCNGDTGQSYPGRAKIQDQAGIASERTLDKALQRLKGDGIIFPIAYPRGGHGRATVWAFGLPAWATEKNMHEIAGDDLDLNPRNNCEIPPQKLRDTPAKIAGATEENRNKQITGGPVESSQNMPEVRNGWTFSRLHSDRGYTEAARLWAEWE